MNTKAERVECANRFIAEIASCGRRFFSYKGCVSRFKVDGRGRVWFINAYNGARIYTHHLGRWRGFTEGGTLRDLVIHLRDFIRTGTPPKLRLGPFPQWLCDGDLWGYGDDMERVRTAAVACGLRQDNGPPVGGSVGLAEILAGERPTPQ